MKTKINDIIELLILMILVWGLVLLFVTVTDDDNKQLPLIIDNNTMLHNLTNNK